jgi:phosphoglycerate dehydrogenase-like enzyme
VAGASATLDIIVIVEGSAKSVVVSFDPNPQMREAIESAIGDLARITYVEGLDDARRAAALSRADALLDWGNRLRPQDLALLGSVELVQVLSAGVEHFPLDLLPEGVALAANGGGWAEPMAEHVLAMTLALAKRLPRNHELLAEGIFDQATRTVELRGALVAVLGYGGIGRASAKLFRAFGARILAVTRSPTDDELVERAASLDELDEILAAADVLVISIPLTRVTRGLIGGRQLSLMKPDAILINVARAAIVDEDALYEHLLATPSFCAGLDVWWQEPRHGGRFTTRRPFFELANVIGSPHNSAMTERSSGEAARHAAENVARALRGEAAQHLVDRSEYSEPR